MAHLPPEFHLFCGPFSTAARVRKNDAEATGAAEDGGVSVKSLANLAVAIFPFAYVFSAPLALTKISTIEKQASRCKVSY